MNDRCDDDDRDKEGRRQLDLPECVAFETVAQNVTLNGPATGEPSLEPASPDGLTKFYPERTLAGHPGASTNLDVHITAPTQWITASASGYAELRIYAETATGRTRVLRARLTSLAWQKTTDGKMAGAVLSVRGHPARAWTVVGVSDSISGGSGGTDFTPATFDLIAWGTEGSTPDTAGESPGILMSDEPAPKRASLGMVWDSTAKVWRPMSGTSTGAINVAISGGSPTTVSGSHTPSTTSQGSPTDAINAQTFPQLWNLSNWVPAVAQTPADGLTVAGSLETCAFNLVWEPSSSQWLIQRANNRGDVYVDFGIPNPASATSQRASLITSTSINQNLKASAAELLKVRASVPTAGTGAWAMFFDKASAPIAGDTPVWQFWVSAGASIGDDFLRTLHCVNGLSCGWSTTSGTYTAVASAPGPICVEYA